jgi:circadian clock protein KaiC
LYFAFGESEAEIVRNTRSVGIDLQQWVDASLLQFHCFRPSLLGLEAHLFAMQKHVREFEPSVVVKDPVSDLLQVGNGLDGLAMLTRQVDFLKAKGVTALFTSLLDDTGHTQGEQQLRSLADSWLMVKTMEGNGEHNRILYIRKSRGTPHSNQIREFLITSQGIELIDVYVGPQGVLTGSARQAQEAQERLDGAARKDDLEGRRVSLGQRREAVEAQAAALWRQFDDEAAAVGRLLDHGSVGLEDRAGQRAEQGRLRGADSEVGAG